MDELRNWAFSLCCAAAAGSLLSLLAPESSLGKVCRFAVKVFFLCCAVLPLRQIGGVLHILPEIQAETAFSAQEVIDVVTGQVEQSAAASIEQEVERCLAEEGIILKKVKADVHVDQDGSISINCIRVVLPPDTGDVPPDASAIDQIVKAKTGVSAILAADDEGGFP